MRECCFQLKKQPFDSSEIRARARDIRYAVLLHRLRLAPSEAVADAAISLALCTNEILVGVKYPRGWYAMTLIETVMSKTLLADLQEQATRLAVLTGNQADIRIVRDCFGHGIRL